ncbi:MAG: hypothetical protein AAF578_13015 [Pseudomonadota bacterium]
MPLVRQAELQPDFELQLEILEIARCPDGLTIEGLASLLVDVDPTDIRNSVAWLIHEHRLLANLSDELFDNVTVLSRRNIH